MNPIPKDSDWVQGRYIVVASSAAAEAEWKALVIRAPEAAKAAFERLSSEPMTRQATRQFPLRGKANKPFWELEVTAGDRIYYAVNIKTMTVIVAVRNDVHTGADVAQLIKKRRNPFDASVAEAKMQEAPVPVKRNDKRK